MSKKTISLLKPSEAQAKWLIENYGYSGLSDLVSSLVRKEWMDRQQCGMHLKSSSSSNPLHELEIGILNDVAGTPGQPLQALVLQESSEPPRPPQNPKSPGTDPYKITRKKRPKKA